MFKKFEYIKQILWVIQLLFNLYNSSTFNEQQIYIKYKAKNYDH